MRLSLVFGIFAMLFSLAVATYKKPLFNGSIFGKRTYDTEYDSTTRAMYAMCEIASESCQALYNQNAEMK
ncbi:unnamed protein product [Leptidea sinapis]|uniref:SIFamide n=1 Tax=Leptidea sinapis TaxID=189913 RepID=A0A5E4R6Z7_9NEOP|nr:unnamed protein product [Leptidea sinapis]